MVFQSLTTWAATWVWHAGQVEPSATEEQCFLRHVFTLSGGWETAFLEVALDDRGSVFLNGERLGGGSNWQRPLKWNVSTRLKQGRNLIAVHAENRQEKAGIIVRLHVQRREGPHTHIRSGATWKASTHSVEGWQKLEFDDAAWPSAKVIASLGEDTWGQVFDPPTATETEHFEVREGFRVERVLSATPNEGSWIAMTFDDKGRIVLSPQSEDHPMLRISALETPQVEVSPLAEGRLVHAMGLLQAHQSLYISGHGPSGTGLYRWVDTNGDDLWTDNETRFLKTLKGEGEHGYHGLRLGPDGMIYMINGNHTRVPSGIAEDSPHRQFAEDHLLPRKWDANGHASGLLAPGGYVARTDPEGKRWELLMGGLRNAYDFDFNADGEIFIFDSDMEWDWGTPWYRPTRVIHGVSGGEYGWRSGSGKWPDHYEDSLPATLEIGIGSPTGMCFGYGAHFPERYQKALYIMDWSYGRIMALHMMPKGSSYFASREPIISGKPLNVTDMAIGPDGGLYFITGGRGTQSGLYRVSYVGDEPVTRVRYDTSIELDARLLRRKLASYHGKKHAQAIPFAWPHLRSPDRWIRYAARLAIESQPIQLWAPMIPSEISHQGSLTALLALARTGSRDWQEPLLAKLHSIVSPDMPVSQKLQALRILQLSLIRMGHPDSETLRMIKTSLNSHYPAENAMLNRALCQLAVHLALPGTIDKTLHLIEQSKYIEDQLSYIFTLRNLREGWNLEQRRRYFSWFNKNRNGAQHPPEILGWFAEVGRSFSYGASFSKYLQNIKLEVTSSLTELEKALLGDVLEGSKKVHHSKPPNPILERGLFTNWTMEDIEPDLHKIASGRDYDRGRLAFQAAQCEACHRFGDNGTAVGPDLNSISNRFGRRDILDSILHPSRVLSSQHVYETIKTKDGQERTGRLMEEDDTKLLLQENPYTENQTRLEKSQVKERHKSSVSPMPEGLLQVLSKEEILDLLAYLESAGNPTSTHFKP
jgi:putative heme-binding domain-containing protein